MSDTLLPHDLSVSSDTPEPAERAVWSGVFSLSFGAVVL